MEVALLLGSTVVPTAFWLWLFVRRDAHPEPPALLLRTFAYGGLAWVLAAALELSVRGVPGPLLVLLLTAVLEEGAKFLATSTAEREREFDEPMDGLVYAVTAALGFSFLENLTYGWQFGVEVAAWHGLITTLAHALFSAPLGYGLARARFGGGRWWRLRGLTLSVALHFAFNGLLTGGAGWWQLPALAVTLGGIFVLVDRLYARWRARQDHDLDHVSRHH